MLNELKDRTVLVTGASGFTGAVLVRRLLDAGARVRAIARASSDVSVLAGVPVEWFRGEVYDEATVAKAAEGVEYIFHVAAAYRQAGIEDAEYQRVHVESTKLLAEAALKSPKFKRFVHVSTVGVHGHIESPPANEQSPFNPGDQYQRTKLEAEQWLHDFARARALPYAVIRPAAIYGPGDRRLFKIFKLASRPFFPVLGFGKCFYHLIHVEDLVSALILAAVHPAAQGQAFICGNCEPVRLVEMARWVAAELGSGFTVVRLPAWPFFLLGGLCELVCKPLGLEPPIYRRRVAFFTKDRAFDTSKIRNLLGFSEKLSNREGVVATTRWYVEQGWLTARGNLEGATPSAPQITKI